VVGTLHHEATPGGLEHRLGTGGPGAVARPDQAVASLYKAGGVHFSHGGLLEPRTHGGSAAQRAECGPCRASKRGSAH